ncbi:MAG: NUDIX hydrolase [Pseudonocardiaceae bacterium]
MRYRACIDVHLILRRGEEILLGQRQNTGFADGSWHLPSGHTEDGESATTALIRGEASEEIGVRIDPSAVRFVHLMHHHTDSGRIALFFEVTSWHGEPTNREPDKCASWDWFALTDPPTDMIPYAAQALTHYTKGEIYAEGGWEQPEEPSSPHA